MTNPENNLPQNPTSKPAPEQKSGSIFGSPRKEGGHPFDLEQSKTAKNPNLLFGKETTEDEPSLLKSKKVVTKTELEDASALNSEGKDKLPKEENEQSITEKIESLKNQKAHLQIEFKAKTTTGDRFEELAKEIQNINNDIKAEEEKLKKLGSKKPNTADGTGTTEPIDKKDAVPRVDAGADAAKQEEAGAEGGRKKLAEAFTEEQEEIKKSEDDYNRFYYEQYDKKLKEDEERKMFVATGAKQEEPRTDVGATAEPVAPQVSPDAGEPELTQEEYSEEQRKLDETQIEAMLKKRKEKEDEGEIEMANREAVNLAREQIGDIFTDQEIIERERKLDKEAEETEHIEYLEYIGDLAAMGLTEPKMSETEWKKQKIEKELIELEKELEETSKKIEKETNSNLKAALEDISKITMEKIGNLEEKLGIIEAKIQEESGGWEKQKVAWELGKSVGKGALKGGWWLTKKGGPIAGKGAILGLAAFGVLIKDLWKLAKIETKIAWKGITGRKVSLMEGWNEVFKKEKEEAKK